ncbi:MAG: 4Fe-4S dicluster domain-containing protein [Deltaproteobacteria bacterium]|nr:4Fe-4S dicluster domain-containing protein [Deltaproteobacteria bacterium]
MSDKRFLKTQSVIPFIEELTGSYRVLAPICHGDSVVFRPYAKGDCVELKRLPTESPKESTFPRNETLMVYERKPATGDAPNAEIVLEETLPEDKTVVFGSRPCGARGKLIFDRVYETESIRDPYYTTRRDNTLFMSLACAAPENTCFCHSVGGGPADPAGSDVLLTPVDGGLVVEAVTEAGAALLGSGLLEAATEDQVQAADAVEQASAALLGDPEPLDQAGEKLIGLFDDKDFWDEMSAKCISCGTCTYLCPTCYCFNITDETAGNQGKRVRTWDTCMYYMFTLEASGHNPRTAKANRLKNRIGHKFSYYPALHDNVVACCGCGRCIKSCPVSVDIRHIVRSAQEYENVTS